LKYLNTIKKIIALFVCLNKWLRKALVKYKSDSHRKMLSLLNFTTISYITFGYRVTPIAKLPVGYVA